MDDSIASSRLGQARFELPAWKGVLSLTAAGILGLLFIVSGVWKLIEPFEWAARVVQAKVPAQFGLAAALGVGVAETFGGVLLLVPRFRRWGAWITGFLLVVFMAYFAWFYKELTGADCSCFPWLKRTVGPGFFIGDAAMLGLAGLAWAWSKRPDSRRGAAIMLGIITVFAFASLGATYARQTGAPAPTSIVVDGKDYPLSVGRHFLYFFDPECSHCFLAAKAMSAYKWSDGTKVVVVPTVNPQYVANFLKESGLRAPVSSDLAKLKQAFPFDNGPFAVAVESGRQKESFRQFENSEPESTLRILGFVE